MQHRLLLHTLCTLLTVGTLITSCDGHRKETQPSDAAITTADSTAAREGISESEQEMTRLLNDFDRQYGKRRIAAAQPIFDLLYNEEMTDSLLHATPDMAADSLEMLVWYWAGEYFYEIQNYSEGLRYATRALPLTYQSGNLMLQGDCERLVGLFYFRMSDYVQAIEHTQKSLESSRKYGEPSRISSSLNTLAGICLVAKQLDDGERYILEALRYSTQAGDSNRMAIQHGMASEIYLAKGEAQQALENALRAYEIDEARGNTGKTGIRLSQMAAAQMALGQDAEAERSLLRAIPILEAAGNRQSLSLCRNQMGELLNHRGAHAEAARYYRQAAEEFAERKDLYSESRARMGLFEALKGSNPNEASQHLLRYAELRDSIYHRDMEQHVSRYNVRYKTEQLALQQARERAEKRVILIASIALVTVLLLIVVLLIYTGRARRRNHRMLKQVSRVREDFFTNITHEFRTPLTVILGLSQDLQNLTDCPPEVSDMARTISRQGNGLLALINQLLDISKIKSAVGNTDWRNGNIVAYITMIVESYRSFARSRNIDLQFIPRGEIEMDFGPDYVVKVMNNLLSNAFKFTPEHGKVNILTWREDDRLHIDISDTGRGMDRETLSHLFEPFYQAGSDQTHLIGSGVGLALVRQIIDSVDGRITVESKPGRGSTFHISVPIRNRCRRPITLDEETNHPILPEDAATPTDSDCSDDNACRLLIIEDNRDIAAYIGARFADRYAVSYATNGTEGLEKAQDLVPDLIITDLIMPGMDGLEVCRQVRANEIINHIPIIVVTAKITEADRIAGIAAGADAYLSKPFNSDELRTRVEKLLEGRRLLQEKFMQTTLIERKPEKGEEAPPEKPEKEEAQDATQSGEADLRFLTKVTDAIYLQLNRRKDIDVSLIATSVCMSNSQFYRKINALTGYNPSAYIRRVKISKAKTLLHESPQMSFGEVAERCGFNDYSNFVRAFKDICGITPTAYRRGIYEEPSDQ